METILEILQTQRASTSAAANATHVIRVTNVTVDVATAVETLMETVSPTTVNHQLVPADLNKLDVAYPWRMPQNFAA